MTKTYSFGEGVEGYSIPVLNEREIRAAAGILFLFMFVAIMIVVFTGDFLMLKYMVSIFLVDISLRVFVNPKYSPLLILGRLIVSRQTPLYVGAAQKKFAWVIGFILSLTIFILLVLMNTFSPITGIICLICLLFLFFETAFGICIGCKLYGLFYKNKAQYCPGEICERKDKQAIQKTSKKQLTVIIGLAIYVILISYFFNESFAVAPSDLWELLTENKQRS